jgi:hypothetical protein
MITMTLVQSFVIIIDHGFHNQSIQESSLHMKNEQVTFLKNIPHTYPSQVMWRDELLIISLKRAIQRSRGNK